MTHRYMRAMLRAATAAGILNGWNGPDVDQCYAVSPKDGPADRWSRDRVELYVAGLEQAHIEPLFRESEPINAYDGGQR